MSRLTTDPSLMLLTTRTIRIVRGREIRWVEMGGGIERSDWVVRFVWPDADGWDRIVRERAAMRM